MSLHPDIERVALLGWHLYPRSARARSGCFEGASAAASCDLDQLARWARQYPGCGWRVVCGPSGLFVLDVDRPGTHKADGFIVLLDLVGKHGAIPPRPMTRSGGSGGAALFFRHDGQPLVGRSGFPAAGLDPHRGQQAVVIPPSRHHGTGGAYSWRIPPWELTPPPIPAWLARLLRPAADPVPTHAWTPTSERARAAVMRAIHRVQDAPSGAANDTLNRQAYALGRWAGAGLLTEQEAADALLTAAQARQVPLREARDTIRSGLRAGQRKPVEARYAG